MTQPTSPSLSVVDAAVQLSFAVQQVLTQVAATEGLTVPQLRVLGILRDRTPSMAAIAAHLRLDRSSVTGLIERAEQRGLIQRSPSPTDGRGVNVELTQRGRAIGVRVQEAATEAIDTLLAGATARDLEALTRITRSIPSAL